MGGSGLIDRGVLGPTESSCPDWLVSRGVNGGLLPLMSSVMGVLLGLYSSLTHPRLLNGLVTCVPNKSTRGQCRCWLHRHLRGSSAMIVDCGTYGDQMQRRSPTWVVTSSADVGCAEHAGPFNYHPCPANRDYEWAVGHRGSCGFVLRESALTSWRA